MVASVIAATIGAAASLYGASKASESAEKAAKAQKKATADATALQKQIYERNTANAKPYLAAGSGALTPYQNALGLNGAQAQADYFNNFQNDPYYQSVLRAGINAIENSAAARGTLYGGNTLKAINDYGGNLQMNAYNNRLNQLSGLVGTGLTASNALAGVGTDYANATSGLLTNPNTNGVQSQYTAGLYNAAGIQGAANALIGGINNYQYGQKMAGYDPSWSNTKITSGNNFFGLF